LGREGQGEGESYFLKLTSVDQGPQFPVGLTKKLLPAALFCGYKNGIVFQQKRIILWSKKAQVNVRIIIQGIIGAIVKNRIIRL
jgi:hypothetical protein